MVLSALARAGGHGADKGRLRIGIVLRGLGCRVGYRQTRGEQGDGDGELGGLGLARVGADLGLRYGDVGVDSRDAGLFLNAIFG